MIWHCDDFTNYYRAGIVGGMRDVAAIKKGIIATLSHCTSTMKNPKITGAPLELNPGASTIGV